MKRVFALLLFLPVAALAFTQAERDQLKTAILAEPSIQTCVLQGQDGCVANWLNSESTFVVWRTSVTKQEIYQTPDWDWTRVDNLTTGEARIWTEMFDNTNHSFNPSFAKVRAGIEEAWKGTAQDETLKANSIYPKCKRNATNAEKVFSTGTGTTLSPGTLTFEGRVSETDVVQILRGN